MVIHEKNRQAKVIDLEKKIASLQAGIQKREADLLNDRSLGQDQSNAFFIKSANYYGQDQVANQDIANLRQQQQQFAQPIQIVPVGTRALTQNKFTYYEKGKPTVKFDSEEQAEAYGISRLNDQTLQQIIDSAPSQKQTGRVKRYVDLAQKELDSRTGKKPAGIEITTKQGLEGAEQRLEKLGLIKAEAQKKLTDNIEALRKSLMPTLKRFGLEKIGLDIVESIENGKADGSYVKNLITLALDAKDVMGTLRHESIHALKELGGFTDAEWRVLTNKAKNEWVKKFITDRGLFKRYQDQYKQDYGTLKGFDEYIQEEAIAEAFRFYSKNKLPAGMIGNIIYRLNKFFEALRNSLNKLGFTTATDIFNKIEEGGIKTLEPVKEGEAVKYDKTRRIDMDFKQVTERIPELQEAAKKVKAGTMTAKQYDKLVNKYKPITPYDFVPTPATKEESIAALGSKAEKEGVWNANIPKGHPVDLRLDINAYKFHGIWVNSIHNAGEDVGFPRTSYSNVSAIKNAKFIVPQDVMLDVATGEKNKTPQAVINGEWEKMSPKQAVDLMNKHLNDPAWAQVGMDPDRHGYFYDRKTTEPVVSADEVIQIGPLVLAKNAVYAPKSQFKYSLRAEEKPLLETSSLENIFKFARDNSDKFKRNRDLKIAIQDQVLTAAEKEGIDLSSTEDETTKHLVKAGIDDAIYALKSNANAVGWYDKTVAKALNVIALMHPEIKTDPDAKFAFTWALAVTSNGIKVDKNFQLAEQAYKAYKKTGKMPTNLSAGEAQQAINNSLELFNLMTDKYGIDNMRKFMATEFTVKQIERITNLEVGGEFADTRVLGASILGPKIGNGFFSNLNGIFDQLTMDRWLMRTWGRWTGSLIEDNARLINNKRGEMNNLIQGLVESKNKQTRERFEQVINKPITEKDFANETAIDALATAINKASIKPANRSIFNKSNLGETIRKTSNSLVGYIDAQKEAPAGPAERNYIREVFSGILDGIRKRGYPNMTMSDLQALLWYPERRLYDAAKESNVSEGYTDDEAPDYANAAAKLARLNGIPESKIKDVEATTEKEYADRTAAIQRDFGKYPSKIGSEGRDVGFAGKERRHFITRGIIRSYRERNEETPNAYKRNGGTDGKGFRVLGQKAIAEFKPVIRFKNALLNADVDTPTFYELDSNGAGLFQKSIASSKKGSQFGAAVYVYPEEEYANMRTFLTKDGKAGFALKGDDIVSVFSTEPHVGGVNGIMQLAVQEGGRRLDAFDTVLPDLYYNNGFKIVARLGWNDEYKPDNWDKEVFLPFNRGEPDVVFMVYDPIYNKAPTKTDGVKVNEYDQGIEQQVKSIEAGGKFSLRAEEVVPESKYSLALGNVDPTTFLVSEKNPNNTGNLAFMPGSAPLAKYPIRLPVGTHDDISDQGYGANHILRRMQTDVKRRPAQVTKEALEDLILHIEDLGKRFKRVYRSGTNLVLYDPLTDDAMFVKPLSDHYEVQSMYSDARIPTKYGNALWSGKNVQPPDAKKFEEKQRGILVQASKEGRVEPKPIGVKVKRVITPNQIEAEAEKKVEPTKGTLSLKKKMSLKAPDTPEVDAFMNRIEGESKIVDENGTPKIMYHGTARDITEFKPKQANAIFLTDSPRFAEGFTDASEAYMVKELKANLSSEELQKLAKEADKRAKKSGDLPEEEMARVLKEQLPSRANIIPVYVYANKPFDFQNNSDVEEVLNNLETESLAVELDRRALRNGNWSEIEKPRFQKAIKAAGFDGFYVIEGGQKNLAVYDSSQIKSAFNVAPTKESKDIRYSFNAPPENHTKLESANTAGKRLTDSINSVIKMFKDPEERIKTRIAFIDPNSGLAKRLQNEEIYTNGVLRGDLLARAKAQTINLIRNGLQTGIPTVNSDGSLIIEIDEVNNLANSQVLADRLNDNYYVKGSGLSGRGFVAEVARALRGKEIIEEDRIHNAKTGENRNREKQVTQEQIKWAEQQLKDVPEIQEVFDIWKKVNTGLINLWENVGLLDKAEADTYRAKKFYVSLAASNTDLDTMMERQLGFTAAGLKSTPKVHKLEGAEYLRDKSGKVVLDEEGNPVPLQRNIWENIDKQYASMLAGAYQNQVRKVAITQLIDAGAARIPTKKRNGVDVGNPDAQGINLRYKDPTNPLADSKGVVHVVVDNATDLAAFESMHYELGPVLKFFGGATNILRAGALLNPMFWIRQLIRDPIHASIVANGGIVTPFHSAKEYINVLRKNSEEAKILASRGVIGQYDSTLDLHTFLEQVGTEKVDQGNVQKMFHKLMQMHEASDAATRVAIFKKEKQSALDKGMTEEEAVNYAVMKSREAINFLVHGNSKILNAARQMIPFLSASITSLDTVYRAATGYNLPASEKEAAKKLFKQRAALMFASSVAYAMLMQDDEEYQKQPNYVKDNNWLIKNPIGEGFLKVPVPYEVGFLFKVVPEVAIRYAYGNDTGKEMVKAYKDGLLHNLPTGGVPVPQAIKPALETIVNYSFFTGNPVESIGESRLPVEMRGRNASETAKFLSGAGLGFVGLSPAKIDNLVQGYFAEAGTFMFGLADQLVYTAKGTEAAAKNLEKQPFFKAFMTDPNADKAVANFYDIQQTANRTAQGFNELKNSGRLEEAREMVEDEEKKMLIASAPTLRKFSENMTKVRRQIEIVKNDQSKTPEERRELVNKLTAQYNIIAQQGVRAADTLGIR
jgi:hypothetical protein